MYCVIHVCCFTKIGYNEVLYENNISKTCAYKILKSHHQYWQMMREDCFSAIYIYRIAYVKHDSFFKSIMSIQVFKE